MSTNDPSPANGVPAKLVDVLLKALENLPPIFRFILAFAILIVLTLLMQAVIPPELMPLFYLLPALGLVGYLVLEFRLLKAKERQPQPSRPLPESEPTEEIPQPKISAPQPATQDPTAAQHTYLRRLQTVCNMLQLQYIDPKSFESEKVRQRVMALADVYTTLDTTAQVRVEAEGEKEKRRRQREPTDRETETRPLTALEAAAGEQQMVLLGDPGSGKSTFVKHLALCLAGEILEPGRDWLARLGMAWRHGPMFPLLIVLREFAQSPHCDGTADGLWRFAAAELDTFAPHLQQRLASEGGVVLLLDGLDEVADEGQRSRVRDAVADFATSRYNHPRNHCLVTCRTYAYQNQRWQLPEAFSIYTLAPFSDERIDAFISAWYEEVYNLGWKSQAEKEDMARRLKAAIHQPSLKVLARRPLLLTVMALLHTTRGRLPDDRVKLYDETVELLLARWQEARLGEESGISRLVDLDRLEAALEKVTFEAHRSQQASEGTADIPEKDLREVLAEDCLGQDYNQAGLLIAYIKERAGLLVEKEPKVYTFPHRTFQEYLAAAHLAIQPAFPQEAARLARQNPTQWREVFLLAVGIMARLKRLAYVALYAVDALCPKGAPTTAAARQTTTDEDWRAAWLAGEALSEIGLPAAQKDDPETTANIRAWLTALAETGALAPVERAAAARALAALADPRPGAGLTADSLPDILWCPVQAQPFTMGSRKGDPDAYPDEHPQHTEGSVRQDFLVARYPLTNAQFAAFVQDDGYTEAWRTCWTDAGWREKERRGWQGPEDYGPPYNLPNHPVVGVSWYEAVAFCRWLTQKLQAAKGEWRMWHQDHLQPFKPPDLSTFQVRLPTEAEWELAARGTDARTYPWGDDWDAAKCNAAETGIGSSSAVGLFPAGASPCGALDMSGNVLEWCATRWTDDYEGYAEKGSSLQDLKGDVLRVWRGGAFGNDRRLARCAYRNWNYPHYRLDSLGVRVVGVGSGVSRLS
jgi:formylglycine-generating enzyme required for sulfatase activity/energy-coupling factor transporter ATP-binding protein EcfA2